MKRFIGIPALAIALALSSATVVAPTGAQAGSRDAILGLTGGFILGSVLQNQSNNNRGYHVERNYSPRYNHYSSRHERHRHHHERRVERERHHDHHSHDFDRHHNG